MASIIVLCILMITFVMNKKLWIFEEEPKEVTVFNEMIIEQAPDGHLIYLTDGEVIKPNPVLIDREDIPIGHDGGVLGLKDKWDSIDPSIKSYELTKDPRFEIYSSPVCQQLSTDQKRQSDTGNQELGLDNKVYTNPVLEPNKKVNSKLKEKDKKNSKEGLKGDKGKSKNDKKAKEGKDKKAGSGCNPISLGYPDIGVLLLTLM